jgi:molecular chaperone DnaK (HSP70)
MIEPTPLCPATQKSGATAVYDLSGGTFNNSILEIGGSVVEVMSADGDSLPDGEDCDMPGQTISPTNLV